jgi:hypothetical protein
MDTSQIATAAVSLVMLSLVVGVIWRLRRRRGHIGAGASGTIYDLLHEDKRKAVEIIVEERAAARDPEDADGNLPALGRKNDW